MFCANYFQTPLLGSLSQMPKYLRDLLEKDWPNDFRKQIFPYIDEYRFTVLYSKNQASRPNSPVNVIIGLLILKEVFQLTDEELIGSIYFDARFQYALNTLDLTVQPVSINTLTNFRKRLSKYMNETGIDLIKQEVESLSQGVAECLKIDQKLMRMDSLMISSSCKKLSRIELIYSVNYSMVKTLNKIAPDVIPNSCQSYLNKGHKNDTIYRTKDTEAESKLETLFKHTEMLYQTAITVGEKVTSTKAFSILSRVIQEQTSIKRIKGFSNRAKKYPQRACKILQTQMPHTENNTVIILVMLLILSMPIMKRTKLLPIMTLNRIPIATPNLPKIFYRVYQKP